MTTTPDFQTELETELDHFDSLRDGSADSDSMDIDQAIRSAWTEQFGEEPELAQDGDQGFDLIDALRAAYEATTGESADDWGKPVAEEPSTLDLADDASVEDMAAEVIAQAEQDQQDQEDAAIIAKAHSWNDAQAKDLIKKGRAELRQFVAARHPDGTKAHPHWSAVEDLVLQVRGIALRQGKPVPSFERAYRMACLVTGLDGPKGAEPQRQNRSTTSETLPSLHEQLSRMQLHELRAIAEDKAGWERAVYGERGKPSKS